MLKLSKLNPHEIDNEPQVNHWPKTKNVYSWLENKVVKNKIQNINESR